MRTAATKQRVTILALFLCSFIVTIIGVIKLSLAVVFRLKEMSPEPPRRDLKFCISAIENSMAIVVANIPIIRGLWTMLSSPPSLLNDETPQQARRAFDSKQTPQIVTKESLNMQQEQQQQHTSSLRSSWKRKLFPSVRDGWRFEVHASTTLSTAKDKQQKNKAAIVVAVGKSAKKQTQTPQSHNDRIVKDLESCFDSSDDEEDEWMRKYRNKGRKGRGNSL